ncbi:MAG: YggT family protein [Magnetococcales bacterium]|nr:YggT family protein [Magnetococcales bacterium]MBF0437906.1 YggT family protein [Magnetococcales bacterium]
MGMFGSIGTLLNFLLEIYSWLILGRVLLSWINPDPYNPIVQFLMQATEPVLKPFRQFIPSIAGMDLSPIFALLAVHLLQRFVAMLFHGGLGGGAVASILNELLGLVHLLLTFYFLLLLARGGFHIYSWHSFRQKRISGIDLRQPLTRFIFQFSEPTIRPLRRWVPTFSGMDITPMVAACLVLILLSLIQDLSLSLSGSSMLHG